MFSVPLFLMSESTVSWADFAGVLAWGFGIPGLILAYYAAILYVPLGLEALRDGRQGRRVGVAG
jgi:hypothetical protein